MGLVLFPFFFFFFLYLSGEKCRLVFFPHCTSWLDTVVHKDKQYIFSLLSGICQEEGGFCYMTIYLRCISIL